MPWLTLLTALTLACAKPPMQPATPTPAPEKPMSEQSISEKVTVVNTTPNPVTVKVTYEGPNRPSSEATFGPIAAGEKGSGEIAIFHDGQFVITASWTAADGSAKVSRPYTAEISPSDPITPVTATLSLMGSFGMWSSVVWDPPATP